MTQTSNPVPVAAIGLGKWAHVLTEAASSSQKIRLVSGFSRSPEKRQAFTQRFGVPAASSLAQILDDKSIQGVLITTPNELHLPIAREAMAAGKHVYVEKPIANSLSDGKLLSVLAEQYRVHLVVGHCARLLPGVRLMKEAIEAGKLGRVCCIEANFSHDRALRLTPNEWRWYDEYAPGGCLSQLAIHQFDVLRYLGGEVLELSSMASKLSPAGAEVDDQSMTSIRFVDGKLGFVGSSWTSPGVFDVKVMGDEALMHYQIDQSAWNCPDLLHRHAMLYMQKRTESFGARRFLDVPAGNMFREELELFADAITHDTAAMLSGANGCASLAMVQAALQSIAEKGRYINVEHVLARA